MLSGRHEMSRKRSENGVAHQGTMRLSSGGVGVQRVQQSNRRWRMEHCLRANPVRVRIDFEAERKPQRLGREVEAGRLEDSIPC